MTQEELDTLTETICKLHIAKDKEELYQLVVQIEDFIYKIYKCNVNRLECENESFYSISNKKVYTPFIPRYIWSLNDKELLINFIHHIEILAELCVEKSKIDRTWEMDFNMSIIYWLDNFIDRYEEIFIQHGVNTSYNFRDYIKTLYRDSENTYDLSLGDEINIEKSKREFISAKFHSTNERFKFELKKKLSKCNYLNELSNLWFITRELIRRTE